MTSRPDDPPVIVPWLAEEAAVSTFTLRLPRRPLSLFGGNPLVRTSDRVQALVMVLAVVVSLLAVPIAAAAGTAVHDSRRLVYAEQVQARHQITATVADEPAAQQGPETSATTVQARWSARGAEHTGQVETQSSARPGDRIEIWVDDYGSRVDQPTPTIHAAGEAVTAAVAIWVSVAAVAAALFVGTRIVCGRIRSAGWQYDFDNLVGPGGGHTTSQP